MCENQKMIIEIEKDDDYEEPTIFEKMQEDAPSIHKTRMLTEFK